MKETLNSKSGVTAVNNPSSGNNSGTGSNKVSKDSTPPSATPPSVGSTGRGTPGPLKSSTEAVNEGNPPSNHSSGGENATPTRQQSVKSDPGTPLGPNNNNVNGSDPVNCDSATPTGGQGTPNELDSQRPNSVSNNSVGSALEDTKSNLNISGTDTPNCGTPSQQGNIPISSANIVDADFYSSFDSKDGGKFKILI